MRKGQLFAIFFSALMLHANQGVIDLKVESNKLGELRMSGFSLSHNTRIRIHGFGASFIDVKGERMGKQVWFGWILDATTRRKVWHMLDNVDNANFIDGSFPVEEEISLPPGNYECYFAAVFTLDVGTQAILHMSDEEARETVLEHDPVMIISGPINKLTPFDAHKHLEELENRALITLDRMVDRRHEVRFLEAKEPVTLRLYTLGEGQRRENSVFDHAWIEDLTRRKRAWSVNLRYADHAGGARKNYLIKQRIDLEPGRYAIHYETDGSHAFDDWNGIPPFDPYFWGITLWPEGERDLQNVSVMQKTQKIVPLVEMVKIGNNEHVKKGIRLKKDMGLRVLCMGEGTRWDGLSDYGWIENAETGQIAWTMALKKARHAGGSDKNRMQNEITHLPAGSYIVHYQTDNTHAYPAWNDRPPFKTDRWGITLWPLEEADRGEVELFDPTEINTTRRVLAELIKPGNDAYLEQVFELSRETTLRVLALGEGEGGMLVDYGWIENDDTGRIVWQMEFSRSEHAGGAEKNRKEEDVITLSPGTYKLLFETDSSHSFGEWNAPAPINPDRYGITVFIDK